MGLGYELPIKKDDDRASSYGSWITKYSNTQQQSFNSWKSSMGGKDKKDAKKNNPWGPVFKDKQNFINMHFC